VAISNENRWGEKLQLSYKNFWNSKKIDPKFLEFQVEILQGLNWERSPGSFLIQLYLPLETSAYVAKLQQNY
jgi:hypothetical protein